MSFIETVFRDTPAKLDYRFIPTAVFTTPEVGTVGLTEEKHLNLPADLHHKIQIYA